MATVGEVYRYLDEKAPFFMQEDFDNAGFLVGRSQQEIKRILIALDITDAVVVEAKELGANLIVAHHPVIWGKLGSVTDEDAVGDRLLTMIENGIAAICAHTNLDSVEGGVNSELARLLGVEETVPLEQGGVDRSGVPYGLGRVGRRKDSVALADFVRNLTRVLSVDGVRMMDAGKEVHHVAVGGGACSSMLPKVAALGCDTFVTSEIKHDQYLLGKTLGVNLVDAGHFSTEAIICPVLERWLVERFADVPMSIAQQQEAYRSVFAE